MPGNAFLQWGQTLRLSQCNSQDPKNLGQGLRKNLHNRTVWNLTFAKLPKKEGEEHQGGGAIGAN